MSKFLIRIVVLLLIPSLIVDSAFAECFPKSATANTNLIVPYFLTEALSGRAIESHDPYATNLRIAQVDLEANLSRGAIKRSEPVMPVSAFSKKRSSRWFEHFVIIYLLAFGILMSPILAASVGLIDADIAIRITAIVTIAASTLFVIVLRTFYRHEPQNPQPEGAQGAGRYQINTVVGRRFFLYLPSLVFVDLFTKGLFQYLLPDSSSPVPPQIIIWPYRLYLLNELDRFEPWHVFGIRLTMGILFASSAFLIRRDVRTKFPTVLRRVLSIAPRSALLILAGVISNGLQITVQGVLTNWVGIGLMKNVVVIGNLGDAFLIIGGICLLGGAFKGIVPYDAAPPAVETFHKNISEEAA